MLLAVTEITKGLAFAIYVVLSKTFNLLKSLFSIFGEHGPLKKRFK